MGSTIDVAFVIAAALLICGGVALIFLGDSADDFEIKPDITAVAVLLILLALAFLAVDSDDSRYSPWLFLVPVVALLAAGRILLGRRARLATWIAAGLFAVLLAAPMMLPQLPVLSELSAALGVHAVLAKP